MTRVKPDLESGMLFLLQRLCPKLPPPVRELQFSKDRKFRFDFAWPGDKKLAIELEGAIWSQTRGAHSTGSGIQRDIIKGNLAVLEGWRVLRYSAVDLRQRPVQVAEEIMAAYFQETR